MDQKVLILDFGSQYTQLIARRVREANVYCEIQPYNFNITHPEEWQAIILSGSPYSVKDPEALHVNIDHTLGHIPVLAVCYGAQYVAQELGGEVKRSQKREYGKAELNILLDDPIFADLDKNSQVWMSHADTILEIPEGFELLASTEGIPVAAYRGSRHGQPVYGLQFHPEVTHTLEGKKILSNFLYRIAGCKPDWTPDSFIQESVRQIREEVGDQEVIMAISGGVDSTVCAYLVQEAIGDQLTCIFVDNGLLRKNEFHQVLDAYKEHGLHVIGVDARHRFWDGLHGVSDPETKRKIIGRTFIEVFDEEAHKLSGISWLAQGTIYPDVIESLSVHGPSATIKSHHNVGGLPDTLNLKLLEPLRFLFKDEVRQVGLALGVPPSIINRHPFPGPGLSIRILGEITEEKIRLLQEADDIFIRSLKDSGWYNQVWQAAVILLNVQSVGVMGDERTYEFVVALRAVNSVDGMTAEWSKLPHELLAKVSNEIINQVKGINRVVYDISTKPPATIEWE